jgi:hypothetical protein
MVRVKRTNLVTRTPVRLTVEIVPDEGPDVLVFLDRQDVHRAGRREEISEEGET